MIILTKFTAGSGKPTAVEYGDAVGSMFMLWCDANEHIKNGGFVTIDINNTTTFYDKPIVI